MRRSKIRQFTRVRRLVWYWWKNNWSVLLLWIFLLPDPKIPYWYSLFAGVVLGLLLVCGTLIPILRRIVRLIRKAYVMVDSKIDYPSVVVGDNITVFTSLHRRPKQTGIVRHIARAKDLEGVEIKNLGGSVFLPKSSITRIIRHK